MTATPTILHEDNHLLVVVKPAGLLAQGDRTGDPTLLDWARSYLREKYAKPGNVFLGLVHRLDRPVSGVMVLARTSKAASRLSEQFRRGTVRKTYLALVTGEPPAPAGELAHLLAARADAQGRTAVLGEGTAAPAAADRGARPARLRYRTLWREPGRALLAVAPLTGRRHQIRVQLAAAGCPIAGDVKYGAPARLPGRVIGLHAWRLALRHPVGEQEPLRFAALPPAAPPWDRLPPGALAAALVEAGAAPLAEPDGGSDL